MQDVVDWLIRIERMSSKFYRNAAVYFNEPELVAFLERSAQDEDSHAAIMTTAIATLRKHPQIKSALLVDQKIRQRVETLLLESQKKLADGSLTREQLVDCIVSVELSEWNDIFLYVVTALKKVESQFNSAAANMQHHLSRIEAYLASTGLGRHKIEALKKLKPVWQERILIIEDDANLAELLAAVLHMAGRIDVAADGAAGLRKMRQRYYRLIVSDVDMPGMDGVSAFRRAVAEFPDIGNRYLFLTGNPDPRLIAFFKNANLRYLIKPASIHALKGAVNEILRRLPSN